MNNGKPILDLTGWERPRRTGAPSVPTVAILAAALAVLTAIPSVPADAAQGVRFEVKYAQPVAPGASFSGDIVITNNTDRNIQIAHLVLWLHDGRRDLMDRNVGKWESYKVTPVAARRARAFPFTIALPADVEPGEIEIQPGGRLIAGRGFSELQPQTYRLVVAHPDTGGGEQASGSWGCMPMMAFYLGVPAIFTGLWRRRRRRLP